MSKSYYRNFEGYLVEGSADFSVDNHGSVVLLRPLTLSAQAWLQENTAEEGEDMAQWYGGALCVEPRYIGDIVEGLQAEGFQGSVV